MSRVVLDASALLALLNAEPGSEHVAKALPNAVVGAVNLAEVVAKLSEHGMPDDAIHETLEGLGLDIHGFDADLAYVAGLLRQSTRSVGHRSATAHAGARSTSRPAVVTADRGWATLKLGVKVRLSR